MNKELKFRVWDLRLNIFLPIKDDGSFNPMWFYHRKDEYIVQQFIGLTDKSGKEIFVGDILVFDNGVKDSEKYYYITIYRPGEYVFLDFHSANENGLAIHHGYGKQMRIVGNIFENPELLK